MGMKLSALLTDPKKDSDGVWFDYVGGVRFKVARWNHPAAQEAMRLALEREVTQFKGAVPKDEINKRSNRVLADHILRDWSGVEDDKGQPVAYTADRAFEIFQSPGSEVLRDDIFLMSSKVDVFRAEGVRADLGNSSGGSNGS